MKYPVVLFDADGMAINSPRFSDRMTAEYGIGWDKMKSFFSGPFQECKVGKADLKTELAKVIEEWGWRGTVDELLIFWLKDDVVNTEIVSLVGELQAKDVRCYLATNQEETRARYLRDGLGLGKVFDGLFVSAEIGFTKDDPNFFEKVYEELARTGISVERDQILFVDHEEKNLAAARKAGFSAHEFRDIESFREELK